MWHYKCIRPILNDHKTWPQFLCPNCRAVADLEADVDDPNDVRWEDDDVDELDKVETDGANAEASMPGTDEDDERLSTSASRVLSIRNGSDQPSPPSMQSKQQHSAPTSTGQPSILIRRNFANSAPFSLGAMPQQPLASRDYLRPITPSGSLFREEDFTPNSDSATLPAMTPGAIELLADGPMTPTNNAGPFVFDGSAGRTAGHNAAAAVAQNAERAA